ncbi:MAG: DUF1343 domain-containing protein, partial [Candidatus Nanopusillus acidilobi]
TNISEGRGTTRPFNIIGAPWLKTERIVKIMNSVSSNPLKGDLLSRKIMEESALAKSRAIVSTYRKLDFPEDIG